MRQLCIAVVPGNPAFPDCLAEGHSIHLRELGGFPERKRPLGVERDGELGQRDPLGADPLEARPLDQLDAGRDGVQREDRRRPGEERRDPFGR